MIFQEPTTSLNPCFTVGFQITEAIKRRPHADWTIAAGPKRDRACSASVGIPDPASFACRPFRTNFPAA